jgi:hypothetical protein
MVGWPRHHRVVRVILGGCWLLSAEESSYAQRVDSPRTVVPERTDMRMPGSFGNGDSDEEVDKLVLGIRELGVKDD